MKGDQTQELNTVTDVKGLLLQQLSYGPKELEVYSKNEGKRNTWSRLSGRDNVKWKFERIPVVIDERRWL